MIRLPGKKWFQTNRSNVLGNLWSTFNIDLQSNLGVTRVSPRLKANTTTADTSDLHSYPSAFEYFDNAFYAVCSFSSTSGGVLKGGDTPEVAFAQDLTVTDPVFTYDSRKSDLEVFNGQLFSTTEDEIYSLDETGGTWTLRGGANPLSIDYFHILKYFKKFNRLYVRDAKETIRSFNTSYSLSSAPAADYSLDLGTGGQYQILSMVCTQEYIWIGTGFLGSLTGKGRIYQWDGISAQPIAEYIVNANAVPAMCVQNNVPYAMDSNGSLLAFSGSSFQEVARLPATNLSSINNYINEGLIHPNGLVATRNGTILAFINNVNEDFDETINENLPSGVWEWSSDYGFTHKYSISYNPAGNSTITDYGQNRIGIAGALFDASVVSAENGRNGTLMLGASFYLNASELDSGIFIDDSNDTVQKFGYLVTTWIQSANLSDVWQKVWLKYKQLLSSTDKITVKYRTREAEPTYISITWVNTTSFTTTTDVSDMQGYEVEVIQGTGSGKTAHISAISESGGTYTVTTDEAVTGVTTGTAKARVQNWTKLFEVDDQTSESVKRSLGAQSERIQLKVTMLFTGENELHEVGIINTPGEPLT